MRIQKILLIALFVHIMTNVFGQNDTSSNKYIESELLSLAGKDGITWKTRGEKFIFKPFVLIQTNANFNYFDDEGLDLYEQDNVLNSGFGIPFALVGFAGKAFDKITYNLTLNTAAKGAGILNQASFDINIKDEFRIRIGKFKTPYNQAYLVRLGQTLFHTLPMSLTTSVNVPFSLNSVNPSIATGFDIGAQFYGVFKNKLEYNLGIFNGTGIEINSPTKTSSDDLGIPSMLYAARIAYMPLGKMPLHQGDPDDLKGRHLLIAPSVSYNVEANWESSNDLRTGLEFAVLVKRFYLSAEGYMLNMAFVERQQIQPNYTFWGSYISMGYFVTNKFQPALRFDVMDRNSTEEDGILYMPAIGANYYIIGHNLKIQTLYQYLGKSGHKDLFHEDDDDNGMPEHLVSLQFQFAF